MNLLIIGNGGREHALAWKLAQHEKVEQIFVVPGNPGMFSEKVTNYPIKEINNETLANFAREKDIALTLVGPEKYLADGIVDYFENEKLLIYGCNKEGALLETSKIYSKEIMRELHIPTAKYFAFDGPEDALLFLNHNQFESGLVVKCDGLASGKGVIVCDNNEQAKDAIDQLFIKNVLNLNNQKILIEERLEGREVSFFVSCLDDEFKFLSTACDYKRLMDNDEGPNTGGMGTYSPSNWLSQREIENIKKDVVKPLLKGLLQKNKGYKGTLFIGLMMTQSGAKVLEFNVRFGDPETQSIMPRIQSGLLELFMAVATHSKERFKKIDLKINEQACVHIVKASHGYPGTLGFPIEKGQIISLAKDEIKFLEDEGKLKIFYSGVDMDNQQLVTSGGRVLGISAIANNKENARGQAYTYAQLVKFQNEHYRQDIAHE